MQIVAVVNKELIKTKKNMNSFYVNTSSDEDNGAEEFEISGRGLNQSSDSDDDSGAEEYEMAGQAFNDFEKSEIRFVPLSMRRRGAIKKDYKGLRLYLMKKGEDLGKLDDEVTKKFNKWDKKRRKTSGGEMEDELLFSPASSMTTVNGKTRKAQPL